MLRFYIVISIIICAINGVKAQSASNIDILTSGTKISIRGMSVPNENTIWVSGINGTIGRSVNGGSNWTWFTVKGFDKRDFRDIEAFDSSTAIAMAIDNPAVIVKTTDGGTTWKTVFEKSGEGLFLDALDFKNTKEGICVGDPIGNNKKRFFIIGTKDGGETWTEDTTVAAVEGEGIFAASGTNIYYLNNPEFDYAFVTGGIVANLHLISINRKTNKVLSIPVIKGTATTGAFSMATDKKDAFYFIGGDYKNPAVKDSNYCFTRNGGANWQKLKGENPFGFRSCIKVIDKKKMIACGTTGVDISNDSGFSWANISSESFNVCMVSKNGRVYFAGDKGRIGKLKNSFFNIKPSLRHAP